MPTGTRSRHDEPAAQQVVAALRVHHDACFAWSLSCCAGIRADAEDVLQEAFVRVLDGRARFAGRSSVRTWLFGVIRRCALEQRRRATVRRVLSAQLLVELVARRAPAAPEVLAESRDAAEVRRALRRLSARQREVLELVAYHDLSIEEAAAVLGVSAGSARTHYERGKQRLGAALVREVPT